MDCDEWKISLMEDLVKSTHLTKSWWSIWSWFLVGKIATECTCDYTDWVMFFYGFGIIKKGNIVEALSQESLVKSYMSQGDLCKLESYLLS